MELWCGDFFHFHIEQAAEIGAFYDRAALIALPEATRQRYAFHLAQLVPPGARGLLISLTRDPGRLFLQDPAGFFGGGARSIVQSTRCAGCSRPTSGSLTWRTANRNPAAFARASGRSSAAAR